MKQNFETEFDVFSNNVDRVARQFFYNRALNACLNDIEKTGDQNSQFWRNVQFNFIQSTFLIFGNIFDKNNKSHSVARLIRFGRKTDFFEKGRRKFQENLKKLLQDFKREDAEYQDESELQARIDGAYLLQDSDWDTIEKEINRARVLWNDNLKGIRDKVMAHNDQLSEEERCDLLKQGKFTVIEEVIDILLTIKNVLFEARHNGKKPDIEYKDQQLRGNAQNDIDSLIASLKGK